MATLSTHDWIMAAMAKLGKEGIDAVKVEPLAAHLGVSKGSFYWHFSSRQSLLDAVRDTWDSMGTRAIIAAIDAHEGSATERLHLLITLTFGRPNVEGIELGMRAWAGHDPDAAATVAAVDERRVSYVAGLLEETGISADDAHARADLMYRTLIGEFVMRSRGAAPLPESTLLHMADWLVRP